MAINPAVKSLLNWSMIWLLVMFGITFLLNFFTHGFFIKYFKVKSSRGKKMLVEVDTLTDRYLTIGHEEEGFLIYKKRWSKNKCRLSIPTGAVYRNLGVNWVNVDEKTNAIMKGDYTAVDGHDAELTESLLIRALNKPALMDNKTKILIILTIIIIVGIIVLGFMNVQILKKITALATV